MSKSIIVKENRNPERKFLKVSVICWCCRARGGSGTSSGRDNGSCCEGAEKDPESRVAKSQHGSEEPTRSSTGISTGAKMVLHPEVWQLWRSSGQGKQTGMGTYVWFGGVGREKGAPCWKRLFSRAEWVWPSPVFTLGPISLLTTSRKEVFRDSYFQHKSLLPRTTYPPSVEKYVPVSIGPSKQGVTLNVWEAEVMEAPLSWRLLRQPLKL